MRWVTLGVGNREMREQTEIRGFKSVISGKRSLSSRSMNLATDPLFYELLAGSYSRLVGASLVPPEIENAFAARWLYEEAPFCVLAHNTDPDPVFIYGNKTAQTCFEYTWAELTTLRSGCRPKT